MANRAPTICNYPGCQELTTGRYCQRHRIAQQAITDRRRGSAQERGYTSRWRKARQVYLSNHPWCTQCLKEGRLTPATDVDHIVPHRGDQRLFWDRENWQPLCHRCHSRKTAREDGGFGNKPPSPPG